MEGFVPGTYKVITSSDGVATIGGKDHHPTGIGDVAVSWKCDGGGVYRHILKKVLYFPESPVNIVSCTALAREFDDVSGTYIQTFWRHSIFVWDHAQFQCTINHPESNLPEMVINENFSSFL